MKLLFEQNLSPRLVNRFADIYPDSKHVFQVSLDQADDRILWEYARQHEFILVTRDADFNELSILRGFPPQIIWIRCGNCSTNEIEAILRLYFEEIKIFSEDTGLGILTLY